MKYDEKREIWQARVDRKIRFYFLIENDKYIFWEELSSRLAQRDFYKIYSKNKINNMDDKERIHKQFEIEDKYFNEFEERGIDRITLKKSWFIFK